MVKKRAFLKGHTGDYVRCVGFSPDGKTLASGGEDKTVKLWDVVTGKENSTLKGHTDEVWFVAFVPDGKTVVSGSLDGTVRLWDITTAKQKASYRCFVPPSDQQWYWSPSWSLSPDGKTLAFAKEEEAVILLDLESGGKERRRFKGNWESPAFSFEGKTIALVMGNQVKLWDVAFGELKLSVKAGTVGPIAFSSDDKTLAVGIVEPLVEEVVKLYEVANGQLKATFNSPTEHFMSLAFSPDGKTLAVGRYMEALQLWDVTTGKEQAATKKYEAELIPGLPYSQFAVSLTFSPDGKILASGSTAGDESGPEVKMWDISGE